MLSIILFGISIIGVSFLPVLPNFEWLLVIFITFTLLVIKTKRYYFFAIPLGVIYATVAGHNILANQLSDKLDGADVVVEDHIMGYKKPAKSKGHPQKLGTDHALRHSLDAGTARSMTLT